MPNADKNGLDNILDELYGNPEENKNDEKDTADSQQHKTGDDTGDAAKAGGEKSTEKSDAEMTDDELALSVNVDLTEEEKGGSNPAPNPKTDDNAKPKVRTAEEVQKIRAEAESDIKELRQAFPELRAIKGLGEIKNVNKYLEYKKKGLSATEAYTLAYAQSRKSSDSSTSGAKKPNLKGSPTGGGVSTEVLSSKDWEEAREMGLSDEDIKKYYKKF